MKKESGIFKDPNGKFLMGINPTWKYNKDSKDGLHQFELAEECVFQISCRPINERLSKIIESNNMVFHDFDLPNVSYHESYQEQDDMHCYIWMCPIDDHFITSMLYYNPKKHSKDIALELMGIRMCLRNIQYFRSEESPRISKPTKKATTNKAKDYSDIESWRNTPDRFMEYITQNDKDRTKVQMLSSIEIDVVKLYALLKCKVSTKPNGFYDLLRGGLPLDNMIWWDFVFECDKGFVQIWRTPYKIEAMYQYEGDFDLTKFLEKNIKKYSKAISEAVKTFDRHTIYINHFKSYQECVKTLWGEISKIDLTPPEAPKLHLSNEKQQKEYYNAIPAFTEKSVKYHALAKSLVLNAAFEIESYLNLIIRVGCKKELKVYPEVLNKFLRQDFSFKVKNLRFYTMIFTSDFDLSNNEYRDAKELMTLRNKYVHFDEDSTHNKLGEILYDEDYPLHPTEEDRPAVESIKQMFHKPELNKVKKAYEVSNAFVSYLESLIHPEIKDNLTFLLNQNPIGYNESNQIYSAVNNPSNVDFFVGFDKNKK